MSSQPTILVKKSDGTSVRMSWDEFQRYRTQNTANKTQNTINKTQRIDDTIQNTEHKTQLTKHSELPAKIGEEAVAMTAPVKEIFVDEAKYVRTYEKDTKLRTTKGGQTEDQKIRRSEDQRLKVEKSTIERVKKDWTAEDNRPLLEDAVDEAVKAKAVSVLPSKRDDLYDLFIKEIRFPVKEEMKSRLNSLIVSFVKGVRTEDQLQGYLQKSEADGGLGFSMAQTEAAITAIKNVWHLASAPQIKKEITPLSAPADLDNIKAVLQESKQVVSSAVPRNGTKPVLQDVAPPKPKIVEPVEKISMGPIDEIASMTLTDFRRLATGGMESIQVLRDKFSALRKESVIIYLQAQDAWFQSPVYKEYQNLIKRAVNEGRKLEEVVRESGIKFEEFVKLAEVGRGI